MYVPHYVLFPVVHILILYEIGDLLIVEIVHICLIAEKNISERGVHVSKLRLKACEALVGQHIVIVFDDMGPTRARETELLGHPSSSSVFLA
jgi:hypothetical protein